MKRPLRYRTMGAVREGRSNPSPYSILWKKFRHTTTYNDMQENINLVYVKMYGNFP